MASLSEASSAVHGRLRLANRGFLQDQARLQAGDGGSRAFDLGLRRAHGDDEIAVVDGGEQVAGLDGLVVFDQHLVHRSRHLRRDGREVGLHVGIVRGLGRCAGRGAIEIERAADRPLRAAGRHW